MSDDYEVGYGKPPKRTQFQPGQSGNKKGRPRESAKKTSSVLKEILNEKITVTEGGKKRRVTKIEAFLKKLLNDALSGDKTAQRLFVSMAKEIGELEIAPENKMRQGGVLRLGPALTAEEWAKRAGEHQRKYREAPTPEVKKPDPADPKT